MAFTGRRRAAGRLQWGRAQQVTTSVSPGREAVFAEALASFVAGAGDAATLAILGVRTAAG